MGVRLLARTTRSVAPTDAGEQLYTYGRRSATFAAVEQVSGLRDRPAGRVPYPAAKRRDDRARPETRSLARDYPDVVLDVTTDNSRVDSSPRASMRASRSASSSRRTWWPYACPRISARRSSAHRSIASHPKPKHPRDLLPRCINFRQGRVSEYQWEFEKGKQSVAVAVDGPLIVDVGDPGARGSRRRRRGLGGRTPQRALHLAGWRAGARARGVVRPVSRATTSTIRAGQQPAALSAMINTLPFNGLNNPRATHPTTVGGRSGSDLAPPSNATRVLSAPTRPA